MRKYFLYGTDLVIVLLAPFLALTIRENFSPAYEKLIAISPFALTGLVISALFFLVVGTHKTVWRYVSINDFMGVLTAVSISMAAILFVTFTFNRLEGVPRSVPLIQWQLTVAGMMFIRLLARMRHKWYRVKNYGEHDNRNHVLILGISPLTEFYMRYVADFTGNEIAIEGIIANDPTLKDRYLNNKKILGTPEDIPQILAQLNVRGITISRIVLTESIKTLPKTTLDILEMWEKQGSLTIERFADRLGLGSSIMTKAPSFNDVLTTMKKDRLTDRLEQIAERFSKYSTYKRLMDVIGSLLLIVIVLPIIAVTAIVVAINLGSPVLFWQKRMGFKGRPFRINKFRTMIDPQDSYGLEVPENERETPVSRFMRRTRMDELPQLYHILVGEMSFVGPRPLLPEDLPRQYPELINERQEIRPGLTGWAQVNGGKDVTKEDKIMMDIYYRRRASLYLDFITVIKTIKMVIYGEEINNASIAEAYDYLGYKRQMDADSTDNHEQTNVMRMTGSIEGFSGSIEDQHTSSKKQPPKAI